MTDMIFDVFLRFYLVASTVFYWPGMSFYMPQEAFIQYSAYIWLAISWVVPAKRKISNAFMAALLAYCVLHTFFVSFDVPGRLTLMNLFLGILTIKIIAERLDFGFKKIGKLFLCLVAFNIGLMALQFVNIDPIFSSMNYDKMPQVDIVGFMGIRFALGLLAAIVLPFIYALSPWYCLALVPLFICSKASTTIGAGAISFLYLAFFRHRKAFWVLMPTVIGACAYYIIFKDLPTGEFDKRLKIWWAGIAVLKTHPYFGYGLGHWNVTKFVTIQENGQPQQWAWAHNEFIQFLFEQGIAGALFLYAYFKDMFRNFKLNYNGHIISACLLSLFICSFFHFPFHVGRFAGIGIYILALAQAHRSTKEVIYKNNEAFDEKSVDSLDYSFTALR